MYPQDFNKLHIPKPPRGCQKPTAMGFVRKTQPAEEVRNAVQGPVILHPDPKPQDYTGLEGLRFDDRGMVLPHTILGSSEDFRSYLEAKGETELVNRLPKSQRCALPEDQRRHHSEAVENEQGIPSGHKNIQRNALQHWQTHMTQHRRQEDFLSNLLDRPVENLLMNQANSFRDRQEQRELLTQVMPLIHSGYGYRVGSEFWSLPQRYGDEMSGIKATLNQTQQGIREPVTHVEQPSSILQESGIICAETLRPASRTWDQSAYLQQQRHKDVNGLEVIGSSKPFTNVTSCCGPLLKKEETELEKMKKEILDPLAQFDDVHSDPLLIPALRFCGQLATWTGNSTTNQGEVGINATILNEALTGEIASSHLELHNDGSTTIFYSWQKLTVPHSFPNLRSQTKSMHFYFNSSSGVIRPGDTQRVEFIFKSKEAGIKTEQWQLNTQPVLLQGASMQVTLKGVALYQDKTAHQRLEKETKLEKIVTVKICRSILDELLQGIRTPERPSSPADLYVTEEQEFISKNSGLGYLHLPVEDLKRLWEEVYPGCTWDLSVDTLRQVLLSLPEEEPAKEESLTQLNSMLLQLSEPFQLKHCQLRAAAIGQQLWRKLLDTMAGEATRLRNLLGLPERETWTDNTEVFLISDADNKDEESEKKRGAAAKEERDGPESRFKDDNKGESRSATGGKATEHSKNLSSTQASLTDTLPDSISQQPPNDENVETVVMDIYTRLLHKKVYALMEDLVDSLCDLMDELDKGDEQYTHY